MSNYIMDIAYTVQNLGCFGIDQLYSYLWRLINYHWTIIRLLNASDTALKYIGEYTVWIFYELIMWPQQVCISTGIGVFTVQCKIHRIWILRILIKISLYFPRNPYDNKLLLVRALTWRHIDDNHSLNQSSLIYKCVPEYNKIKTYVHIHTHTSLNNIYGLLGI